MTSSDSGSYYQVVKKHPKKTRIRKAFIWLTAVLLCLVAFLSGGYYSGHYYNILIKELNDYEQQSKRLAKEKNELADQVALLESTAKIDQDAMNHVRLSIKQLEDEKEQFKTELSLFKRVLFPNAQERGVKVGYVNVFASEDPQKFRMQLAVLQAKTKPSILQGKISVLVKGFQRNKEDIIVLFEGTEAEASSLKLNFRYFQIFPNKDELYDFILPEGFNPKKIHIKVAIAKGTATSFDQIFEWEKELQTYVQKNENYE